MLGTSLMALVIKGSIFSLGGQSTVWPQGILEDPGEAIAGAFGQTFGFQSRAEPSFACKAFLGEKTMQWANFCRGPNLWLDLDVPMVGGQDLFIHMPEH